MTLTENRKLSVCLMAGVALMMAWYVIVVRPSDEARELVIECMVDRDDLSRASYESCIVDLRGEHRPSHRQVSL
jgi:hypothetical protein